MAFTTTHLKFFADYIERELGIIYSASNYFQLEKRLNDIAKSLGIASADELYRKAQDGIAGFMKQMLLDAATNNETQFFRDPKAFNAFEKGIIPALRKRSPDMKVMRIWCAASSFGQEPYSLAMLLTEMAAKDPLMPRFEVVASDISSAALSRAKEGKYSQLEIQRGLPAPLLVKYFTKTGDDYWVLKPEIRVCVQFKTQNLLESFAALGSFDMVLCRNVLIYQNEEKKKDIIGRITDRISNGGFLMLGAAESLLGLSSAYDQVLSEGAVYFRKKG